MRWCFWKDPSTEKPPRLPSLEEASHYEMRRYIRFALRQLRHQQQTAEPERASEITETIDYIISNVGHHPLNDDLRRCILRAQATLDTLSSTPSQG